MTMTTRIRVLDKVDPHEFFRRGQELLAERDADKRPVEAQLFSDKQSEWADDLGCWRIANQLGQGLPGIWEVEYRVDEPLRAKDAEHIEDECDEDCDGRYHDKTCWCEGSIDTSYGYQDAFGGVGNLHAWFLAQLFNWLDERGAKWSWYHESRGTWHDSAEDLVLLCTSGTEAQDWFRNAVLPKIEADAAAHGGKVEWL